MSRDLVARGHRVTGVDVSPTLADGALLPFGAGAFDLVVAYNSLMDVDDMPAVCAEIARLLEPRGRLCVCVQHPVWDAGKFVGPGPEATFVLGPTYFGPRRSRGTFERHGLRVTFDGWCFSIDDYSRAFESAGFFIKSLREPLPGPMAPATTLGRRPPIFLMVRLRKSA